MAVHSDDVERILLEVTLGRSGPVDESTELRKLREQLAKEVVEIRDKGGVVDVPHEIPAMPEGAQLESKREQAIDEMTLRKLGAML